MWAPAAATVCGDEKWPESRQVRRLNRAHESLGRWGPWGAGGGERCRERCVRGRERGGGGGLCGDEYEKASAATRGWRRARAWTLRGRAAGRGHAAQVREPDKGGWLKALAPRGASGRGGRERAARGRSEGCGSGAGCVYRSLNLIYGSSLQYRMSPFVNSRALGSSGSGSTGVAATGGADSDDKMMRRWFAVADLSRALHGFLVFEVSWRDVHGINYLNELLTDTSLALEARYMKKWEFYSAEQAASCTPKWFLGRASEAKALRGYLRSLHQQQQQQEEDDDSMLLLLRGACSSPSLRVVSEDTSSGADADPDDVSAETPRTRRRRRRRKEDRSAEAAEPFVSPAQYSDTLILFRFRDSELPFKLQQIMMSDIRLLTLLESGLPSWVIFFQSYPLFCHLYRPWMRPLARSLYVLVSLVTVIIGFYDLYKNVPLLKAAAARICGPLFGWIETWDMVTRIQYLGTILFLRNLRKCLQGLLTLLRMARALLRPLAELAGPLLDACGDLFEVLASGALSGVGSAWALLVDLAEMLWAPFDLVFDYVVGAVGSLCPLLQVLLLPVRWAVAMASCAGSLLSNSYNFSKDIWETISSIFELNHMSEAQQSAFDMSLLKALWNDLFSQIFRAIRSILNGILVFFASCNRHRLSIYNHVQSRLRHMLRVARLAPCSCQCKTKRRSGQNDEDDAVECDICK